MKNLNFFKRTYKQYKVKFDMLILPLQHAHLILYYWHLRPIGSDDISDLRSTNRAVYVFRVSEQTFSTFKAHAHVSTFVHYRTMTSRSKQMEQTFGFWTEMGPMSELVHSITLKYTSDDKFVDSYWYFVAWMTDILLSYIVIKWRSML